MKQSVFFVVGLVAAIAFGNLAGAARGQEKAAGRTLKVKLSYTGSGTVDESHLIQVFVFDSPDFVSGSGMPIAWKGAGAKDGTVTFADLDKSPLYVSVVYDPKGGYNEVTGPPPSGSSVSMYTKGGGTPEPIKVEAGGTAEIELAFDDSYKLP